MSGLPIYRGQGNASYRTATSLPGARRGQTVPYDINGKPQGPISNALADGDYGDIVASGSGTVLSFDSGVVTAFARTFLDDANAAAVRSTLGVEASIAAGTTAQYWRGDKTWQTLDKAAVGLGSVDNTADAAKNVLSATKLTTSRTLTGSGDVAWTGSFDGSANFSVTTTIQPGAVTLAKMANVATATVFYRKTAGTGAPEVQTLATLKTDLGLTGTNSGDQTIVLTGDATGSGTGSFAVTVGKINGVSLAALATGVLKNTTGTGAPSIAVAADFPTFNQNTTGSAATLTTARNIEGQAFNGSADITVIAPGTHAATSKATPVDADELPLVDSAASNVLKKLTWANLKATLKTYLDTLYQPVASVLTTLAASDILTAWTAFTPTVTAVSGTITTYSASGAYKQVGKTVHFRMLITISNAGTSSGGNDVTLPATAASNRQAACGAEVGATGKALACLFLSTTVLRVRFYDATFAGATGNQFQINGTYEAA